MLRSALACAGCCAGICLAPASPAMAQSWGELELVPDGFVSFAAGLVGPGEALRELANGAPAGRISPYPQLPESVGLAAYDRRPDGSLLVATSVPWLSPEGILFGDDRLRLVDPTPAEPPILPVIEVRSRIDAVAHYGGSRILLSFDSTMDFAPDGSFEDEDLILVDTATLEVSPFFDGSAFGIPPEADLDAAAWLPGTGRLLLSFDIPLILGSTLVLPSDVAEIDPVIGAWSLAYAAPERDPSWMHRDLVALGAWTASQPAALFADGFERGSSVRWNVSVP